MLFRHIVVAVVLGSVLGMDNLPAGNFKHFGNCVLKFVRLSDNFEYIDLAEYLIHINNPTDLIYTVSERRSFSSLEIEFGKMPYDFKFYEICTVTIFLKFGMEDHKFRVYYTYYTRDTHRSLVQSVFILISQQPPQNILKMGNRFEFRVPYRIFSVHIRRNVSNTFFPLELEWFFVCPLCEKKFVPVNYNTNITTMTVRTFQAHGWRHDIFISTNSKSLDRRCNKGLHYTAPLGLICTTEELVYLAISDKLNITFIISSTTRALESMTGFYLQHANRDVFYYMHTNQLFALNYKTYHGIYCNFKVWSEQSDLIVWVSPLAPMVWLDCAVIVLLLVILRILKDLIKPGKIRINFKLVEKLEDVVFATFLTFVRQHSNMTNFSTWISVSLLFTSFMIVAQYELFLTVNLVMPPKHEQLRTLSEFFSHDYTVVYPSEETEGVASVKTQLEQEFKEKSLPDFPHHKTIIIRYDTSTADYYVGFSLLSV